MFFTVKFVARLTLCCLTSSAALACGDGKVLFEDNSKPCCLHGCSMRRASRSNGPEGLTYALKPNTYRAKLHKASLYDDYEVCATFTADVAGEEESGTYSAYIWASDIDNTYGVSISPFGTFAVFRLQRGKYLAQNSLE